MNPATPDPALTEFLDISSLNRAAHLPAAHLRIMKGWKYIVASWDHPEKRPLSEPLPFPFLSTRMA